MTTLPPPTLHLNGTSFDELSQQLTDCLNALRKAQDQLFKPNLRDYYTGRNRNDFDEAFSWNIQANNAIAKIKVDIIDVLERLSDQQAERLKR